jgi:hypothetical protein
LALRTAWYTDGRQKAVPVGEALALGVAAAESDAVGELVGLAGGRLAESDAEGTRVDEKECAPTG